MTGAEEHQDAQNPEEGDAESKLQPSQEKKKGKKPRAPQPEGYSRKSRSLGLLCKSFLGLFCQTPGVIVHVDSAAQSLGVERRRIYDILNVLHGFEMMEKNMKSQYEWKGIGSLQIFLDRLLYEANAEVEGPESDMDDRKERSMARLSQRFAQMFMLSQIKALELEEAAIALLGASDESGQTKTKVRRLYDIANIMCALGMIEKTASQETGKTWFRWLGVDGISAVISSAGAEIAASVQERAAALGPAGDPSVLLAGLVDPTGALNASNMQQMQQQMQLPPLSHLTMPVPALEGGLPQPDQAFELAQLMQMPQFLFGFGAGVPNSALEAQGTAAATAAVAAAAAAGNTAAAATPVEGTEPAVGDKRPLPLTTPGTGNGDNAGEGNGVGASVPSGNGEPSAQRQKVHPLKRFVQLDSETAAKHPPTGPALFPGGPSGPGAAAMWPGAWQSMVNPAALGLAGMYSPFWPGGGAIPGAPTPGAEGGDPPSAVPQAAAAAAGEAATATAAGETEGATAGGSDNGVPPFLPQIVPGGMPFPWLPHLNGEGGMPAIPGTEIGQAPGAGADQATMDAYTASVQAAYVNWYTSCCSMMKEQQGALEEGAAPAEGPAAENAAGVAASGPREEGEAAVPAAEVKEVGENETAV